MTDTPQSDLLTRLGNALAGQYRIERVLGQGGMGTVFLALDITLDRPVAIKVISPEVGTSAEVRQRFVQEAKTVARLRQPNIVAVYSAGEADGLLYFVMEYVPGESLRDRLTREKRIPVHDAVHILRDLALALDYAHGASVVHRDVKPENVLLDRESGRAMLTDFGVARAFSGDTRLTGAGFVLGSPRYMSPEQAAGESALDGRSDLYSLGLIGYEMLSGEPAIDAPSAASILVKQLTVVPPSLTLAAPGTPPEVATTIARLLEKSPDARLQRGAAVAAALVGESFDDNTPTNKIGRTSNAARQAAPAARSRTRWMIGTAAAVIAVAGALWMRNAGGPANDKSWLVAPFEVQGSDRSLDWLREGSLNMLTLSLAQWTDLSVVEYERALDLLRDAGLDEKRVGLEDARSIANQAGAGRVVMGQVTALGDSTVVTATLYNAANGESIEKARAAAIKSNDPRPLFEAVAAQLLNLAGAPRVTIELAKQTTTSVVAYRHYLDGLRLLNRWQLRDADSAFTLALAADSTFALAYYKKSLGLGWISPGLMEQGPLLDNAIRYVDRLPPRQQEVVRGHVELNRGFEALFITRDSAVARQRFVAARERMLRLITADSSDADAWYTLGDASYHLALNTAMTQSRDSIAKYVNSALLGFHRTVALDSSFHLAYQHLADVYRQAGAPGSFIVLAGDSVRPSGTSEYDQRIGSADKIAALRDTAQHRALRAAIGWRDADPDAEPAVRTLSDTYLQLRQPDSALAVLMAAKRRPSLAGNTLLNWRLPILQAAQGQAGAAGTLLALARNTPVDTLKRLAFSDRVLTLFALLTVAGQTGTPGLITEATRLLPLTDAAIPGSPMPTASIMRWLGAGVSVAMGLPVTPAIRKALADGMQSLDAERAMGNEGARSQFPIMYAAYLATRDTMYLGAVQRWAGSPTNDFPELRALAALRQKDTATAMRIARGFLSADSTSRVQLSMNGARVVARAEAIAELGDLRAAVAMYNAIDPARFAGDAVPEVTWGVFVRSYLARAKLYEQLGEPANAITAYQAFLRYWASGEAPVQPQLRDARDAIARLKDAPRTSTPGVTKGE